MDDSSAVQSTESRGYSFDDLSTWRDGTQVGRANFSVEWTPSHEVVDDCPTAVF